MKYPPQPWRLAADARLSAWRVPPGDLPRLPAGVEPVVLGGHAAVFTAWLDYRPPGELSYHELLAAVAVRGPRLSATVTEIWVDSEVSLAGGRELWAIPKDLADLEFTTGRAFTATAATGGDWIATAAFTRRPGLPLRVPAFFDVAQDRAGEILRTPVRVRLRPRPAAAGWSFNPRGPLGYLTGRKPLASLELVSPELVFGARSRGAQ